MKKLMLVALSIFAAGQLNANRDCGVTEGPVIPGQTFTVPDKQCPACPICPKQEYDLQQAKCECTPRLIPATVTVQDVCPTKSCHVCKKACHIRHHGCKSGCHAHVGHSHTEGGAVVEEKSYNNNSSYTKKANNTKAGVQRKAAGVRKSVE